MEEVGAESAKLVRATMRSVNRSRLLQIFFWPPAVAADPLPLQMAPMRGFDQLDERHTATPRWDLKSQDRGRESA